MASCFSDKKGGYRAGRRFHLLSGLSVCLSDGCVRFVGFSIIPSIGTELLLSEYLPVYYRANDKKCKNSTSYIHFVGMVFIMRVHIGRGCIMISEPKTNRYGACDRRIDSNSIGLLPDNVCSGSRKSSGTRRTTAGIKNF